MSLEDIKKRWSDPNLEENLKRFHKAEWYLKLVEDYRKLVSVAEAAKKCLEHPLMVSALDDTSLGIASGSLWKDTRSLMEALAALEKE